MASIARVSPFPTATTLKGIHEACYNAWIKKPNWLGDSLFDTYEMLDGDKLRKAVREARGEETEPEGQYWSKSATDIKEELQRHFDRTAGTPQPMYGKSGGDVPSTSG